MSGRIYIKGAREHNLKNIDIEIPRDKLIVVTGLSGSGKSSLAFDTIYAEGQRRYVESLSSYARQFLEQMQKPDVEYIEGLPPTISIEQRTGHATPRSTVATSTEIYDYLRILFARIGKPFCYRCDHPISQQTPQQIVDNIFELPEGTRLVVLAPLIRGKKGTHRELFERIKREGYVRVRVNGRIMELGSIPNLNKNKRHNIEAVVDRLVLSKADQRRRLSDSVEAALKLGEGLMQLLRENNGRWEERLYSQLYACPFCGISFGELQPRLFSFNSPYGACSNCDGLGTRLELDVDLIVPDKKARLQDGAIDAWRKCGRRMAMHYYNRLWEFCQDFNISLSDRFCDLPDRIRNILLYGTNHQDQEEFGAYFEGVIPNLMHRFEVTESDYIKRRILSYMNELPCPQCKGMRLRPEALSVRIAGKNIYEVTTMTIEQALKFFTHLNLRREERHIARLVLKEIISRLTFLCNVGLSYLTLDRKSITLAGGEAQRIRLASQVGSGLVGVCYVLDEPTIGLHQRDNRQLLDTLYRLRDLGNTIIVVEHDEDTIRAADHIVDMGPGAGAHGGKIVAQGTLQDIIACRDSITGHYLSGRKSIPIPPQRRNLNMRISLEVIGAREHNLKNIDVKFPLGGLICVTGISGSGKSTLINEILYKAVARRLYGSKEKPGLHTRIEGIEYIDKVIVIDQSPIGRTPRSNPATYTGVFAEIRRLFALTKESRARGYLPGRFSFNVKGGRCEACEGQGTKVIEMHFLPEVYVRCEECKGLRYNRETLEIKFKGKNIAEILSMSVEEALNLFENFPVIIRILRTLYDVGLGYIALGQSSTTLSGGEAQRVKLASELGRVSTSHTLYILDEPTTGLHFADLERLLSVLNRLVDMGNTVIVIEHNMHVIKLADYIIDLGPEGGERGGWIVATGTPEQISNNPNSYTGAFLKKFLRPRLVESGVLQKV
jgi:excinuclease ABC subunit A